MRKQYVQCTGCGAVVVSIPEKLMHEPIWTEVLQEFLERKSFTVGIGPDYSIKIESCRCTPSKSPEIRATYDHPLPITLVSDKPLSRQESEEIMRRFTENLQPITVVYPEPPTIEWIGPDRMKDLFINLIEWKNITFPKSTALSNVKHLKKEVKELEEFLEAPGASDKDIRHELADCFFLLFGAANLLGYSFDDICYSLEDKLEIVKKRKWGEPDADGVVLHVKEDGIPEDLKNPDEYLQF